jgi:predicted aspartyl protease
VRFRTGRDHLIVMSARVNGRGPFKFVLDTGASMTVVSPSVARRAGVALSGPRASAAGAGPRVPARLARLRSLEIGPVRATRLTVAILSLGALNRATRLELGGIIGYNLLRRYRVTIDYAAGRLVFRPARPASRVASRRRG